MSKAQLLMGISLLLAGILVMWLMVRPRNQNASALRGKSLYSSHCQNCHGAEGRGLGALIPSLRHSDLLDLNRLACAIRYGKEGLLELEGQTYNGYMPPNFSLDDGEVRDLVNYVRLTFGDSLESNLELPQIQEALRNCSQAQPKLEW